MTLIKPTDEDKDRIFAEAKAEIESKLNKPFAKFKPKEKAEVADLVWAKLHKFQRTSSERKEQ